MMKETNDKLFEVYLDPCHRLYSCTHCHTHLASHNELLSKSFIGGSGRAYLFNSVVNVKCGRRVKRQMISGPHTVSDVSCKKCHTIVGWKYEQVHSENQRHKEGKYVIEEKHMIKDNGWN